MINITMVASGSSGNAYLIDDGKTLMQIECGIPMVRVTQKIGRLPDVLLVSHCHGDHAKDISHYVKCGVMVITGTETAEKYGVKGSVKEITNALSQDKLECKYIENGTYRIVAFELVHDVQCYGFYIYSTEAKKWILYLSDTGIMPYKFGGINYLLCECNYSEEILKKQKEEGTYQQYADRLFYTHFSLEKFIDMIKSNPSWQKSLNEVYLLHMSDNNSDGEKFKREIQKLTGAVVYVG